MTHGRVVYAGGEDEGYDAVIYFYYLHAVRQGGGEHQPERCRDTLRL